MQPTAKRLSTWLAIIIALLLIPLVAMQFTDEVNWDIVDFTIMGTVLVVIALAYELIARKMPRGSYRIAFAVGLLGAFLLFWVNGAVGIIGGEGQPANLMYGAVFVVGLIGSLLSRFKASGMSITLYMAALTQMLVPVLAIIIWPPPETSWSPSIAGVFLMSGFFAALFILSAYLFRQASRTKTEDQVVGQ